MFLLSFRVMSGSQFRRNVLQIVFQFFPEVANSSSVHQTSAFHFYLIVAIFVQKMNNH